MTRDRSPHTHFSLSSDGTSGKYEALSVALSFPGEYRGRVEKIAEALAGTQAEALINETGYHRRDGELEKLRQRLAESRA